MPPSGLRRMESALSMGDQVYDPDRYTRVFGTAAALKDAQTGEQTRVGQGTVTDMHIFGALTATQHPVRGKLKGRYEKAEEDYKVVSSGISFGLMLIGLGLCTTLIYLLYLLFS